MKYSSLIFEIVCKVVTDYPKFVKYFMGVPNADKKISTKFVHKQYVNDIF